jgi:hypothetical protein
MGHDEVYIETNQFRRQFRKPVLLSFRPAEFDDKVFALDVTEFAQTNAQCFQSARDTRGRTRTEEPDPVHPRSRLLGKSAERRCERTRAKRDNEFAAFIHYPP